MTTLDLTAIEQRATAIGPTSIAWKAGSRVADDLLALVAEVRALRGLLAEMSNSAMPHESTCARVRGVSLACDCVTGRMRDRLDAALGSKEQP